MSIKSDSPPCLSASWSSLAEFGNFEDCTAFYIKIDNAELMLLLHLDQTPAKYLHLSRSCSPTFLDLFQVSDLHSNNPFLVTSPSSLCLKNIFQSISQAIADPLAKKQTSKWLNKRAKCFSVSVPHDILFLQAFRVLSLGSVATLRCKVNNPKIIYYIKLSQRSHISLASNNNKKISQNPRNSEVLFVVERG